MVKIYYSDDVIDEQHFSTLLDCITRNDIPHRSYLFDADNKRYVIGRLLLKKALLEQNIRVDLQAIESTPYGKPYYLHAPNFNITHSNNIVLVAVSENQIGIDIEYISDTDFNSYTKVLSQNEILHIQNSSAHNQAFYSIWTRKEAVLKSNGTGLCNAMDLLDTLNDLVLYKGVKYHLKELQIHKDYKCHIASDKEITCIEMNKIIFSQIIN